jgi:hypothetical protein
MTNETPSNETPQSLTFKDYIYQQIQIDKSLLPRVNLLFKESDLGIDSKTPDTVDNVVSAMDSIQTKDSRWYQGTAVIVDAVMALIKPGKASAEIRGKLRTAVAYDMEDLFQRYNNASKDTGAER